VSTNGGVWPHWRRDGRELYFLTSADAGKVMAADIQVSGASIRAGVPHELFDSGYLDEFHPGGNYNRYAVSDDGQQFLFPRLPGDAAADTTASTPITVVVNWTAALNKK
jgi:hypothetical protein